MINVKEFYKAQDDIEKLKVDHTDHVEATYTKEEVYNKTQTYTKTEIDSKDEAIKDTATTLKSKVDINTENLSLATKELEEARDNKGTLLEKLSEIEDRATENIAKNYISVTGEGNVKVDHCYNGVIKDVALKGKTAYVKTAEVITGTGEVVITPAIDGTLKELNIDGDTKYVKTAEPIAGEGKLTIENSVAGTIPELNIDGKTVLVKHGKSSSNNGGELIVTDAIDGPAKGLEIKGNTLLVKHGKEASGIGSVTVSDCIGGEAKGLEIKGQTLVNLVKCKETNLIPPNGRTPIIDLERPLKAGVKYTVLFDLKSNTTTLDSSFRLVYQGPTYTSVFSIKNLYNGKVCNVITPAKDAHAIAPYVQSQDNELGLGYIIDNLMILEGDWTNKPLPDYFEGMKSLGQESTSSPLSSVAEAENGLVTVRTTGKNLYKEKLEQGRWRIISGEPLVKHEIGTGFRCADIMNVKPSTSYKTTVTTNTDIAYYVLADKNKLVTSLARLTDNLRIVTGSDDYYLVWYSVDVTENSVEFKQLEEGDISTEFVPYQESVVQVQLPQSMGSAKDVKNGVEDIIELNKNITQVCDSYSITGDEDWNYEPTTKYFFFAGNKHKTFSEVKSNFLPAINDQKLDGIWSGNNYFLCIRKLDIETVEDFKIWIKNLEYKDVVYELRTHIIHELPNLDKLSTFKAITTATTTNSIPNGGITLGYPVEEEIVTVPTKYCRLDSLGAGGASAFSPLESVGQAENGMITVRTTGKNKLKTKNFVVVDTWKINVGSIENLRNNTVYTVCGECTSYNGTGIHMSSSDFKITGVGKFIQKVNIGEINSTDFTFYQTGGNNFTLIDVMIIEGDYSNSDISTEYEELKESVITLPIPSSMGSLKGTVRFKDEGHLDKVVQFCNKAIWIGVEDWGIGQTHTNHLVFKINRPLDCPNLIQEVVCNKFENKNIYTDDVRGIKFQAGNGQVMIGVPKNELETEDVAGWIKLLQKWDTEGNPLEVVYELETPIIHEITPTGSLSTFKGMTKLNTENIVPHGGIKLGYPIAEEVVTIPSEYCRLDSVGANGATQVGEEGLISVRTTGKNKFKFDDIVNAANVIEKEGEAYKTLKIINKEMHTLKLTCKDTSMIMPDSYVGVSDIECSSAMWNWLYHKTVNPNTNGWLPEAVLSRVEFNVNFGYTDFSNVLRVLSNYDIQLEEGDISTNYEPFQESVVTLPIPSSMGSLKGTNLAQDTTNLSGSIIQKCIKQTVTSSNIQIVNVVVEDLTVRFDFRTLGGSNANGETKSNRYKSGTNGNGDVGVSLYPTDGNRMLTRTLKADLETFDEVGFKKILDTWEAEGNPLELIYELKDYIIHELPQVDKLSTFKAITPLATFDNLTHVTIEDELKPSFDMYKPIEEVYMDEWTKHCRLQSVGEEGIVAVKTCGKNLFDKTKPYDTPYKGQARSRECRYDKSSDLIVSKGESGVDNSNFQKIILKPNTMYSFSFDTVGMTQRVAIHNGKIQIESAGAGGSVDKRNTHSMMSGDTGQFWVSVLTVGDKPSTPYGLRNFQIEEVIEATGYEPFHEQITNVPLPASMGSLKGIGDVHDEIDIASGRIIQRVASEKISLVSSQLSKNVDTDTYIGGYFSDQKVTQATLTLCDKLNVEVWSEVANSYKNCLWISGSTSWGFMIEKTLAGNTIISLTEYLNSLDITIEYALKEPIIHEIPPHLVETFSTKTYLSVEDTIAPAIESYYPIEEVVTPTWTKHCRLDSIGDDENGVVTVRTTGKNLFDYREFIGDSIKEIPNGFILVDSHQTNIEVNMQKKVTLSFYIESNGIDHTGAALFGFYDMEGSLSYATPTANFKRTFDNLKSIISLNYCNGTHRITNMQIEEGATATAYEPFKEDISVITLPEGMKALRGIEDISDEVDINAGTITQRVGEITLDGSGTEWATYRDNREHGTYCYRLSLEGIKGGRLLKSSAFENMSPNDNVTRECLYTYAHDNIYIQVTIEKSNYIYSGLEFGKWLQDNPTNVVYELETPIVHTIPKDTLNCYTGVTNLSIADYLNPTLSGKFPVNTPATIGDMREEGRLKGIELKKKDEEIAMLRKEAYGLSLETAMLKEEASALSLETVRLEEEIAKTKDKASDADREIVKAKLSAHMANSRIDRANDNTAIIEEDAKELRESSKKTTTKLHAQDVELTSNDFEMDFRLMDMEIAIEEMLNTAVPLPIRRSTTFAMSPYDMMKKLIINSHYEKEDMEYKISVYLRRDRITQDEADELRTLMLIFPPKN